MTMTTGRYAMLGMVSLLAIAAAACDHHADLEVRTFALEHLRPHEAAALIEPYVFFDRPEAPGSVSTIEGAISVRETPDNLEQIARVLADFDEPLPDTRLHFQLIEADGFTDPDARIAEVETELRKLFQFGGYRLAGEAFVAATEASEIQQGMTVEGGRFQISGQVYRMSPGVVRLEGITLWNSLGDIALQTTVSIRPGQTLVLGSSPGQSASATLLLTVRAEEVSGPA